MRLLFLLYLLSALAVLPVIAQSDERRTLTATTIEAGAIRLDGILDEPAWASASSESGFFQFRPSPGDPVSEDTEALVLLGPTALYIAMRMHDSQPDAIDARLARRDQGASTDNAIVAIDSHGDRRTGFLFRITPGGIKTDRLFYDDTQSDDSWDAVWDVVTRRDAGGWTAEFEIPLSQLRYAGGDGPHEWGLQFVRIHHRTGEISYWSPRLPTVDGYVSQFGTMVIPDVLPAPHRFEAVPYVASALTRAPGDTADPFFEETDLEPRVGLDLKLGLTSDLTLAATVNPDFGQVEADPAQVNLGGFELFFEERRPFFVEGTDVFNMQPRRLIGNRRPDLLYTRRIGRAPQRTSFVPPEAQEAAGDDGVIYTDAPQQSTILGAAKLSGRIGRFSVGLLNATTRAEYGRFQAFDVDGRIVGDDRALVEPLSNYLVGRAKGTFGGTVVGGLLTSVIRDTDDPALAALLPGTATVAGADVEHPIGEQWRLTGQMAGSLTTGREGAIAEIQTAFPRLYSRPDADYLTLDSTQTRLSGWTAEANLLKTDGEHWTGGIHASATSPGFDANELGFQSRADFANMDGIVAYSQNKAQGPFQSWDASLFGGMSWNFGGDRIRTVLATRINTLLHNFWSVGLYADAVPRYDDDRLTRGGPIARRDAGGAIFLNMATNSRKPISGTASGGFYGNELGRFGVSASLGMEAQPSSSLSLSLSPEIRVSGDPRQYITAFDEPAATATFGRRYVFGQLDQTTLAVVGRVDWTFTPTLSLQLFARPFVSRGQYSAFKAFDRPGAFRLPEYGTDLGTATENADGSTTIDPGDGGEAFTLDRDFTVRSLQGNAVLRWEYRPGSALFLVWQQQREGLGGDGSLRFRRDVGGLFSDPSTNVFLVKLSFWMG